MVWLPEPSRADPTAVQAVAELHDTPESALSLLGLGVDWTVQLVPFQLCANVTNVEALFSDQPTAMQLSAELHDTPVSSLWPLLGAGRIFQVEPFHVSDKVVAGPKRFSREPFWCHPTAVHAAAEAHETPSSSPFGFGDEEVFHLLPFHLSTRAIREPEPLTELPTAKQSWAELHDTACMSLSVSPPGFGLDWIFQVEPFHTSTRVSSAKELFSNHPTAVHSWAELHDTPARRLSSAPLGFGLDTVFQVLPFQVSTKVL
jgi:hypothetical protein